ncbi:hypothetical protein ACFLQN_00775 [Candidatus Aenigmatarchaeota archaeon]
MKGQWFIISAVVASGAFLAISVLFRGYFILDSNIISQMDEDFYFQNIKQELYRIEGMQGDCERNVVEFAEFAKQSMAKKGYYLFVNYTGSCPYVFGILLASERAVYYENVIPEEILGSP